jgi:hypothetical protein
MALEVFGKIFGINNRAMSFNQRSYFYNIYSINIKMVSCNVDASSEDDSELDSDSDVNYLLVILSADGTIRFMSSKRWHGFMSLIGFVT